ncbi:N-acetylglucosamine kinase [Planosporangium mesophilum]|uniref:N-acetylglucosamine kinase n=1 Tax=Planosporangium mesophilum TaxID=689768 RepID=A0A8J3TLX3_9ACTN|nr:BadF/BadG/BcrA/BcrD ATPase family protein [Planosporangium mesophilum]NJC82785.1 ATPase [Planosporangium mesophilum]GII23745.1 N-acetylglucosamine kinase [Planosporangium mesophilum]
MSDFRVLGLDIGGTGTRALLATSDGERLGSGTAAGGNPSAHGAEVAAARVAEALGAALAGSDPTAVRACVVGLAGVSKYAAEPHTAEVFGRIWRDAGLTCPVQVVSDVAVAYAAGTARPAGSILLAGTGAVAAEVRGREPVRIHDGYGWLLGDDGSGFWIGRQAVRATLAAIDGRAAPTELADLVLEWYFEVLPETDTAGTASVEPGLDRAERRVAAALVQEVVNRPPVALAGLAPLVMRACAAGDPVAEEIVRRAGGMLVATLSRTRPAASDTPIVLAGAILGASTPVHDLVVKEIAERWSRAEVAVSRDGAAGAAWLAALPQLSDGDAEALHRRLVAG